MNSKLEQPKANVLPWWKKLFFSLIVLGLFFGSLELGLAITGFPKQQVVADPWVGFSNWHPLLEETTDQQGQAIMVTSKSKLIWFNHLKFSKKKPANTFRIFSLGGSTTYGHPYWDNMSFSRWLREHLPLVDKQQNWEVINGGGISYASYRVARLMEELTQYEPDLFIVFSAHNEFLERRTYSSMFEQSPLQRDASAWLSRSRIWQTASGLLRPPAAQNPSREVINESKDLLPPEVDEMLNHSIGPIDYHRDPTWHEHVVRHYEANLERMVSVARGANAKIIFVVPASNLKNCEPFKSELDSNLSGDQLLTAENLIDQARQAWRKNRSSSKPAWQQVLTIDSRYPEASYRLGQLAFDEEDVATAGKHFRDALNHDVCPLRATDAICQKIRDVADRRKVPIVDFEKQLADLCEAQKQPAIFGEEHFVDHVHPTVDVHRRLSLWIIDTLLKAKLIRGQSLSDGTKNQLLLEISQRVTAELDNQTQGIAYRNLAKTMHWAGRYEESQPLAEDTLEFLTNDPEALFVLADSLRNLGKTEAALREYDFLTGLYPEYDRAYHPYGELLAQNRDWNPAKAFLLLAHVREPENANVLYWLGATHLELKEYDWAIEALTKVRHKHPEDPKTLFMLAQAFVGDEQPQEAKKVFEKMIELGYDMPAVQEELDRLNK
jgi:tetratricopeptide (TPR) repeat protein